MVQHDGRARCLSPKEDSLLKMKIQVHGPLNFYGLLLSRAFSVLGGIVFKFGLSWFLYIKTGSALVLGSSLMFLSLPEFMAPVMGTLADRHSKRTILLMTNGLSAITVLGLVLIMSTAPSTLLLAIYSGAFFLGVLDVLDWPAFQAIFPVMLPKHQLVQANSLWHGLEALIVILSPVLAGLLIAFSLTLTLWVIALSYFCSLLVLLVIRLPNTETAKKSASWHSDLGAGWSYIWSNREIRGVLGISIV